MSQRDQPGPEQPRRILRPKQAEPAELRKRTRRDLLLAAVSTAAGFGAWKWVRASKQFDGVPWPQRRMLEFNEQLANGLFSNSHHTPVITPGSAPPNPRVNEDIGMTDDLDREQWRLHVTGLASGDRTFTMDDIQSLPKVRATMRLCCIEGWSILVNWGGCRLADFASRYSATATRYVSMATPDRQYYVGLDSASAMHPQTLLCYEIDDKPLTLGHGAPLRLVIPTKYGIKNIKRIGHVSFTNQRPDDYWAQQGYDWYAGL